jgi:hypothetical protein
MIDFYDFIIAERGDVLTPNIKKFLQIAATFLKVPLSLDFEYANLYELDAKEEAEVKEKYSNIADKKIKNVIALVESQLLTPDEGRAMLIKEGNLIDDVTRNILNEGSWS